MATGWGNQLTRQIGEHLVVAELGRRGYVAAPYAGNVPMYDILAANKCGQAIPIQVKAINGGSWQFDAKHYLNIVKGKDGQKIEGVKRLPNPSQRVLIEFNRWLGIGPGPLLREVLLDSRDDRLFDLGSWDPGDRIESGCSGLSVQAGL